MINFIKPREEAKFIYIGIINKLHINLYQEEAFAPLNQQKELTKFVLYINTANLHILYKKMFN